MTSEPDIEEWSKRFNDARWPHDMHVRYALVEEAKQNGWGRKQMIDAIFAERGRRRAAKEAS